MFALYLWCGVRRKNDHRSAFHRQNLSSFSGVWSEPNQMLYPSRIDCIIVTTSRCIPKYDAGNQCYLFEAFHPVHLKRRLNEDGIPTVSITLTSVSLKTRPYGCLVSDSGVFYSMKKFHNAPLLMFLSTMALHVPVKHARFVNRMFLYHAVEMTFVCCSSG